MKNNYNEIEMRIFDVLAEDCAEYAQNIAVNVGTEMAIDMPVDTGRARSNVRIAPYSDTKYERRPFFPYPEGSGPNKTESINLASVSRTLESEASKIPPFRKSYIVNNATDQESEEKYYYAVDLDSGSSRQTQAGMVDRAIRKGLALADNAMRFYLSRTKRL